MIAALLPDRLESGMRLKSKTGHVYTVHTTSHRDGYDEPLYKLSNTRGLCSGTLWSRDQLQEEGAVLVEEKEEAGDDPVGAV